MDQELLELLVCPKTKQKLVPLQTNLLKEINEKIAKKQIKNIGNELITKEADEALLEPNDQVVYFVIDHIPILIYENAYQLNNEIS